MFRRPFRFLMERLSLPEQAEKLRLRIVQQWHDLQAWWKSAPDKLRNLPDTNYRLGLSLREQGHILDAALRFRMVLKLEPNHAWAQYYLGSCLLELGNLPEAMEHYRRALERDTNIPEARYMLAVHGGGDMPTTAPLSVISSHFDRLASIYDAQYVTTMDYQGHHMAYRSLAPLLQDGVHYSILDLGCGTGLLGTMLRPKADYLRGVDISAQMLEQAKSRRYGAGAALVYDSLVHLDIAGFLPKETTKRYDLILAAGVFNYSGDFAPWLPATVVLLKPGGMLVFSIELSDGAPMELLPVMGRYRHSRNYIHTALANAGCKSILEEDFILYQDCPGLQVIAVKHYEH